MEPLPDSKAFKDYKDSALTFTEQQKIFLSVMEYALAVGAVEATFNLVGSKQDRDSFAEVLQYLCVKALKLNSLYDKGQQDEV